MTGDRSTTTSGGAKVVFNVDDGGYAEQVGGYAGHQLLVVGHGRIVAPKHEIFVAPERVLSAADIESLHEAMLDDRRCCSSLPGEPEYIAVALEEDPHFHARASPRDEVGLMVDIEGVAAAISTVTRREPTFPSAELAKLFTPVAKAYSCAVAVSYTVDGVDPDHAWDDMPFQPGERKELRERLRCDPHEIHVRVFTLGNTTVANLLSAGRDVGALLHAYEQGAIDAIRTRNLVRAGRPHLLRGLIENDWLEVKSGPYRINGPEPAKARSRIELAQDVARFANGETDAVLIVGIKEVRQGKKFSLGAVAPIPLVDIDPDQYRAIIDQRVVPPIDGLLVEQISLGNDQGVLMISIPKQAREMQPYLVSGAIVGERVEGAFFSIVRRRGEASITTSAEQIHAYIVAGRAFLRGGRPDQRSH